jgi:hypothetical protein
MARKEKAVTILLSLASIILITIPPKLLLLQHGGVSFFITVAATTTIFISLLEIKQERFIKGMALIGLAVAFPLLYPPYLSLMLSPNKIPQDFTEQLEVFIQVIVLACSGSGGSIIANYGDTNTTDFLKHNPISSPPDKTQDIEKLITQGKNLNSKLNLLIGISTAALAMALLALLINLLK